VDLFDNTERQLPFEIPKDSEYAANWDESLRGYRISVPNGEIFYAEKFFDSKISNRTVEYFQENFSCDWQSDAWKALVRGDLSLIGFKNIKWKQDSIKLYGKVIPLPRLTSWYGDTGRSYTYSGITSAPNEWNKGLLYLKREIENCAGVEFNSVLLNWYRDGEDYLNWHSDDEKELGDNPVIASANFGETRDFVVRRKDDKTKKIALPLGHGTLLLMQGELQHYWEHSVPKRMKVNGSRFNLTFRSIR
jgi:alkylated DNA repair dioxygenase AlkB